MSAILRHVMHLIVQSSINHTSVLQHSLCVLLEGFDFLLSQMVTILKTDLYLHTQRLECSIVGSCASSAAHRCSSNMATASDTLSRAPHRSISLVFISNLTENRSALSCMSSVEALRSLTNRVLELCRLDEIGVPFQVFLSTQFRSLYFVKMSCNRELFFLDVAVRQYLPVFELLSCEDQSLLVGMNAFLVFHIGDGVAGLRYRT